MKVLIGMALWQTTGFVETLLHLVGLDGTVPDFSTLSRRQRILAVNIPYRGCKDPLHLLIDNTGNHIGDAPVLPYLLSQNSADEEIGSVTADGAYHTRKC
ncbi:Transposase DDE domain-containing protein [Paracoccus saliphilus]|uniref:Transposase DDE domain-containing protein n=1 Tax=Paracoccus saliphilus TaxID=405559 RepID=A0AA46A495_9RHOB|nr:Transposase DDE domain-containing protein [Paracoccus saliphilus]